MQFTGDDKLQHFDTVFERLQLLGADVKWSINTAYQVSSFIFTRLSHAFEFLGAPPFLIRNLPCSLHRLYANKIPTEAPTPNSIPLRVSTCPNLP